MRTRLNSLEKKFLLLYVDVFGYGRYSLTKSCSTFLLRFYDKNINQISLSRIYGNSIDEIFDSLNFVGFLW